MEVQGISQFGFDICIRSRNGKDHDCSQEAGEDKTGTDYLAKTRQFNHVIVK